MDNAGAHWPDAQVLQGGDVAADVAHAQERAKRRRGIDYNREVAFEKAPAPGFFDTGEEAEMTRAIGKEFRPMTLEAMEGTRRKVRARCLVWRTAALLVLPGPGFPSMPWLSSGADAS